tara:strand:+ start:2445 stop:2717 length:273 start_codon:yes stop_codon:yes gene_type:complete
MDVRIVENEVRGAVLFTGLEQALLGFGTQQGREAIAIYSLKKILLILSRDMSQADAEEFFLFNIQGLWAGDRTPIVLNDTISTEEVMKWL